MICLNIAGIKLKFNDNIPEIIHNYIEKKYVNFLSHNDFKMLEFFMNFNCSDIIAGFGYNDVRIGYKVEQGDNFLFVYEGNFKIGKIYLCIENSICDIELQYFNEELIDLVLSVIWRFVAVHYGRVVFHSSAIEINGNAILFCGHSGGGKSTIINLIQQTNLTDEMACVYINEKEIPCYCSIPWRNTSFKNVVLPLKRIFIIEKANSIYMQPLTFLMAELLLQKFYYFNLWGYGTRDKTLQVLHKIINSVEVKKLYFSINNQSELIKIIKGA